jgi:hypothetical protein
MPYGDKKSYSFFKMKGSPHKTGTIEGTSAYKKKTWPPNEEVFRKDADYQEDLKQSNRKRIAEEKAKYKAGKITKKELDASIKEINQYIDF